MTWQDRIVIDPAILVGKPTIKGTRIAVEFVVDLLARGWTADDVLREYDHLARKTSRHALPTPAPCCSPSEYT